MRSVKQGRGDLIIQGDRRLFYSSPGKKRVIYYGERRVVNWEARQKKPVKISEKGRCRSYFEKKVRGGGRGSCDKRDN